MKTKKRFTKKELLKRGVRNKRVTKKRINKILRKSKTMGGYNILTCDPDMLINKSDKLIGKGAFGKVYLCNREDCIKPKEAAEKKNRLKSIWNSIFGR